MKKPRKELPASSVQMKGPLQGLLISPDHYARTSILYGGQTGTIREGHRDYRPGTVMLCCHLVPWAVMAQITEVHHTTLRKVTHVDWEAAGFSSKQRMFEGLRQFYPDMKPSSPVTVIRWDPDSVRGFLKDNDLEYRLHPNVLYAKINHRS